MGYVIFAVIAVILILPLIYELPNYVYDRKYGVISFLRWPTVIYVTLFLLLLAAIATDGIFMLELTLETLSFKAVRIWIGIIILSVSVIYFFRLIPIYYDESFGVYSKEKRVGTFVREMIALGVFAVGLFFVSVYILSFCLDAVVVIALMLWRIRKFVVVCRRK